jgi:hypothetical protein
MKPMAANTAPATASKITITIGDFGGGGAMLVMPDPPLAAFYLWEGAPRHRLRS